MPAPIRVLIADDHDSLREGLSILLEFEDDIQVVAEARDGREAVDQALIHQPDVIVMDITMPRLDGLQATRQIRQMLPETHVLMISAEDDNTGVEQAVACGALGFICKHTSLMNVPNAIREVDAGNTFFAMTPRPSPETESESAVEHVEF